MDLKGAQAEMQASRKIVELNSISRLELHPLSAGEAGGIRGVAVKCIDITKNSDCEGSLLVRY